MTEKYSLIFILFLFLTACHSTGQKTKESSDTTPDRTTTTTIENDSFNYKTFMVGHDWGYDIYKGSQLLVHQPNIPAMAGNKGFSSEQKAIAVANLAIQKLRKGIMPPTISIEELDSLKVTE
jgi:hypothetical protein